MFMVALALGGCRKIEPPADEILPVHKFTDNVILTKAGYVSKAGNKLYYDLEVVSCKNGITHTQFPDSAFKKHGITSPLINIEPQSVQRSEEHQNLAYDVVVLIDLTQPDLNDWMGPGFMNELSRLLRMGVKDEDKRVGVGFFARNTNGGTQVLFCRNEATGSIFDNDEQELFTFLTENFKLIGQYENSCMNDAISLSVDELLSLSTGHSRNIVLINGNYDDGQGMTDAQVLQKCKDNHVAVSYVNWGVNYCGYVNRAIETEGFYAFTNSIGNFSSVVFCLHELLAKNYAKYTVRCMATKSGAWSVGNYLCSQIPVVYLQEINSQYFQENLYDDFEMDGALPYYIIAK